LNPNAPSVDYPVGRFFMGKRLFAILSIATGLALWWGVPAGGLTGWRAGLLLVCWLSVLLGSLFALRQTQQKCWLSWNGHRWCVLAVMPEADREGSFLGLSDRSLETKFQEGANLKVHLDWQNYLYISLTTLKGDSEWFWLTRATFPERWHGFRCAVYSRSE
jgi:hypothetical protein